MKKMMRLISETHLNNKRLVAICLSLFLLLPLFAHAEDVEDWLQFGESQSLATSNSYRPITVTFDKAFPAGVTPLIFITPTISSNNPENNDGPASIFITNVTNQGFTWIQREPPTSRNRNYIRSQIMQNVHWLAITEGEHTLTSDVQLAAFSVQTRRATNLNIFDSSWEQVANDVNLYDVAMTQTQTDNNNGRCWVTSVGRPLNNNDKSALQLQLDTTRVYDLIRRCKPSNAFRAATETIAYLALKRSSGEVNYNADKMLRFQIGEGQTLNNQGNNTRSLSDQCQSTTPLTEVNFGDNLRLIAKKSTRNGSDGGWLRRCNLTSTSVSAVVDEDTYRGDRVHVSETFGYAAFELVDKANPNPPIDHFEIGYTNEPFTCKPEPMVIKACANSDCSKLVTSDVTVDLSSNIPTSQGGWYADEAQNQRITRTDITNGQKQVYLRSLSMNQINIGISASTPNALNPTLCKKGNAVASQAACSFNFAASGFVFNVQNDYANKTQTVNVQARQLNNNGNRCVPTFRNRTRTVYFASTYVEPNSPAVNARTLIDTYAPDTGTVSAPVSNNEATPTPRRLRFNNRGETSFTLSYPEAGRVELSMKFWRNNPTVGNPHVFGSDQFVMSPMGFCIKAEQNAGNYSGGFLPASAFKKAGENFNLSVEAKAWQANGDSDYCNNLTTHNYQQTNIALSHNLVLPANGAVGSISRTSFNMAAQTTPNLVQQSVSEVGVFTFAAKAPNYMGTAQPIAQSTSNNIGRFVPASFKVDTNSVIPQCTTFTYLDRPVSSRFRLTALNEQRSPTQNYIGDFAKAEVNLIARNSNKDLSARLTDAQFLPPPISWANGVVSLQMQPTLRRLAPTSTIRVDGPFTQTDIGVTINDNDGNIAGVNTPDITLSSCNSPSCQAKRINSAPLVFRHGRLTAYNSNGVESKPILMTLNTEFWDGSTWVKNTKDNCTTLQKPDLGLASSVSTTPSNPYNPQEPNGYHYQPALGTNQTIIRTLFPESAMSTIFTSGEAKLLWRATSSNNAPIYRGTITAPVQTPDYLKWYWQWDNATATQLDDPRASVVFGRYRGHDKIIYRREITP
ncbi:MAG: DUF6701 domain-containing protein [Parashewanella sp.]